MIHSHIDLPRKKTCLKRKLNQPFTKQRQFLKPLKKKKKKSLENIVGKRENAGNQHFLVFQQCFLPYQRHI